VSSVSRPVFDDDFWNTFSEFLIAIVISPVIVTLPVIVILVVTA
jgi:hypothetical protein